MSVYDSKVMQHFVFYIIDDSFPISEYGVYIPSSISEEIKSLVEELVEGLAYGNRYYNVGIPSRK